MQQLHRIPFDHVVQRIEVHPGGRYALCWTWPDNQEAVLAVARLDDGEIVLRVREGITDAAFAGQNDLLLTSHLDGRVLVWNVAQGEQVRSIEAHPGGALSIAVAATDNMFFSGGEDGTTRLWDIESGLDLNMLELQAGPVRCVAITQNAHWGIAACENGTIAVCDLADDSEIRHIASYPGPALCASLSADERLLFADARNGESVVVVADPPPEDLALLAARITKGLASNPKMGVRRTEPSHQRPFFAFDPHGRRAASAHGDGTIRLYGIEDGLPPEQIFHGHHGPVHAITFSPDGERVLTAGTNGIRVSNVASGQAIAGAACAHLRCLATTSQGNLVVGGGGAFSPGVGKRPRPGLVDCALHVWKLATSDPSEDLSADLSAELSEARSTELSEERSPEKSAE